MKIFSELKRVSGLLKARGNGWALCGGIVAGIYRDTPRLTADIDIALVDGPKSSAKATAGKILRELGYTPALGFVSHPDGSGKQCNALVMCRSGDDERFVGIDFLLPVFPWVPPAVERAQSNLVDYGFARLPTVTCEDLLLAKFCAINGNPDRPYDKDDVLSILKKQKNIDLEYIKAQSNLMKIAVPKWAF